MRKMIGISVGFVTNSSSMVYHFPRHLLDDPKIQTVLKAFEVDGGFVGSDLWYRSACGSLAITREQKDAVRDQLVNNEYDARGPAVDVDSDDVVVVYGDEHHDIAYTIGHMLEEAARAAGIPCAGDEYN